MAAPDATEPAPADAFADSVTGVAALADPIRRDLYRFVAAQPDPVSRDQASEGVGVARHTVKFHLDRLVQEGLLDTEFKRLSGRRGPGAGRPAKLYKRSERQLSITLPERRYDLAGALMARAIENSAHDGTSVVDALRAAAADLGTTLGHQAREAAITDAGPAGLVAATCATLAAQGYEPHCHGALISLANCPFDALAREHTELVCGMNLALLDAVVKGVSDDTGDVSLAARLDPTVDRCCVVLDTG